MRLVRLIKFKLKYYRHLFLWKLSVHRLRRELHSVGLETSHLTDAQFCDKLDIGMGKIKAYSDEHDIKNTTVMNFLLHVHPEFISETFELPIIRKPIKISFFN